MFELFEVLVNLENGEIGWVVERRENWHPAAQQLAGDPQTIFSTVKGTSTGAYPLQWQTTGWTVDAVNQRLVDLYPNYQVALDAGFGVPWQRLKWEHLQLLLNGARLSVEVDFYGLHVGEVLLNSIFFGCEVDFDLALAWAVRVYRSWDLTPAMVERLAKSSIFWTNKWIDYQETVELFALLSASEGGDQ